MNQLNGIGGSIVGSTSLLIVFFQSLKILIPIFVFEGLFGVDKAKA